MKGVNIPKNRDVRKPKIMKWLRWLNRVGRFSAHYWGLLIAAIIFIIAVVAPFLRTTEWLADKVKILLSPHLIYSNTGEFVPNDKSAAFIAVGLILLLAFLTISFTLALYSFQQRENPNIKHRFRKMQRSLKRAVENSRKIQTTLYPQDNPPYSFDETHFTITMDRDGTAWVKRLDSLRAHDRPLHFWGLTTSTEPEADRVEFLEEINFKIRELNDDKFKVTYLLTENEPHRKGISVFHLPHIDPGEQEPRRVETTYCWPGMLRRLLNQGEEDWEWRTVSGHKIPLLEFKFFYHPKIGRVSCEIVSKPPSWPAPTLQEITSDSNWPGWCYRVEQAPEGVFTYVFRLRRVEKGLAKPATSTPAPKM